MSRWPTPSSTILYLHARRRHRREGAASVDAAAGAASEATPLVCAAGVTIAATTATLALASLPLYSNVGPGLAVATGTTLVVAVTFVPALMAVCGRFIDWPTRPDAHQPESREPKRSRLTSHRLVTVAVVAVGLAGLGGAAAVLSHASIGVDLISDLPDGAEPARAARAAAEGFGPGTVAPTELVVAAPGVAEQRDALDRLQQQLSQFPGVDVVIGPSQQPLPIRAGVFLAPSGNAARFIIVMRDDPYRAAAARDLADLRDQLPRLLADASITHAHAAFAGDTALSAALVRLTVHDLVWIGALVVGLDFVILGLFLRSLVSPLFVLATGCLVVAVALAVTAVTTGELTFYVPFAAALLLMSFGADYSVMVIGQVWRAADSEPFGAAVRSGVMRSRSVLTSAGFALAGSFALLFLVPVGAFEQFATTMVTGIALDTFVVRPLVLPALLALAGRTSMWPSHPRPSASHRLFEPPAQQPRVDGISGEKAEHHAHLHQEPVGGMVRVQSGRREPHQLHQRHPSEHPDLEGGQ